MYQRLFSVVIACCKCINTILGIGNLQLAGDNLLFDLLQSILDLLRNLNLALIKGITYTVLCKTQRQSLSSLEIAV